jgi:hypothetical protein
MPLTESRRRPKRVTVSNEQRDASVGNAMKYSQRPRRRKKSEGGNSFRNLFWSSRSNFNFGSIGKLLTFSFALCLLVLFTLQTTLFSASDEPSLVGASAPFQRRYNQSRAIVKKNKELYDLVYKLASERLLPPDQTNWPDYERRPYELKSTYGAAIEKCDVTIVLTDPRLGFPKYDFGPGQPIWFALESIGAYASEACVLLQTCT